MVIQMHKQVIVNKSVCVLGGGMLQFCVIFFHSNACSAMLNSELLMKTCQYVYQHIGKADVLLLKTLFFFYSTVTTFYCHYNCIHCFTLGHCFLPDGDYKCITLLQKLLHLNSITIFILNYELKCLCSYHNLVIFIASYCS